MLEILRSDSGHKIVYEYVEERCELPLGEAVRELPLREEIKRGLQRRGIERLYEYQVEALKRILEGKNVVVVAGTGAGKTEAFLLPILNEILDEPYRGVQALLLYPTKALARDQRQRIDEILSAIFGIRCAIYDGDTPIRERKAIFENPPQILVSNPDMLHVALLHSREFRRLVSNLKWVVLDDMHVYSGVLGAHVAYVVRRLKRIVRSRLQFVGASATVGNPEEAGAKIFGEEVEVVEAGRGRRGRVVHVFVKPLARSRRAEVLRLLEICIREGLKTIVFVDSHRSAELLKVVANKRGLRVEVHRAGLLPEARRRVEERLKRGELEAVVATPTLELGIDIGALDAVILHSIPPTLSKYVQRTGRAGRRGQTAYVLTVLGEDPISAYYERHPEEFFKQPLDPVFVELENEEIAKLHLLAMMLEGPLSPRDLGEFEKRVLEELVKEKYARAGKYVRITKRGLAYLRERRSIRGVGEVVKIVTKSGAVIGTREMPMALRELHPGAVYLHGGSPYLSIELRRGRAVVVPLPKDYDLVTYPLYYSIPSELEVLDAGEVCGLEVKYLALSLDETVYGFVVKRFPTMETVGEHVLGEELSYSFKTKGVLLAIPPPSGWSPEDCAEAFHAVEHALISAAQMIVGASQTDLGGVSYPSGHVYIYDSYPGGSGVSRTLMRRLREVLERALEIVDKCNCADGCPRCIYSPYCGNNNRYLSRRRAAEILRLVVEEGVEGSREPRSGRPLV